MRSIAVVFMVSGWLVCATGPAQAKPVSQSRKDICQWGSQVAQSAQQSRLAGKSLASTRRTLEQRPYSKPWMKKMALGITEQTFASGSRASPKVVMDTYYQGCLKHQMARS